MARLWRHIVGERGINRIRVYERRPGGPLWVEWYNASGRHQKTLTKLTGIPFMGNDPGDRELAIKVAKRMAAKQRKNREIERLHVLAGLTKE